MTPDRWDVVVVGAGSSGCALAARLVDAGRRVLVLEAGADHPQPADFPAALRDAATLGAATPGHPANWTYSAQLAEDVSYPVVRGRVLGGSSAVNGGYFVRGTPADFDGWAAAGNDLWSAAAVLPAFCRSETDADFGDRPGHGADGPMPVARPPGTTRSPTPSPPPAPSWASRPSRTRTAGARRATARSRSTWPTACG